MVDVGVAVVAVVVVAAAVVALVELSTSCYYQ